MRKSVVIILSIILVLAFAFPASAFSIVPVKSIALNKTNITLKVGETAKLVSTLAPKNTTEKKLTYITANKNIATVDNAGKITGVAFGTTKITVKTPNKKVFATCQITVKQAPVRLPKSMGDANTFSSEDMNEMLADAQKANIDWLKFKGTTINVSLYAGVTNNNKASSVKAFEALTGIKVNVELVPASQMLDKWLIMFSSGNPPDAPYINNTVITQYAESNWLEPLQPLYDNPALTDKAWFNKGDLAPGSVDSFTVNNNWYGIAFANDKQILYYRKDLYEKKGLKIPATMDELYANAIKLNEPGIAGFASRFAKDAGSAFSFNGIVRNYGAYLISPDGKVMVNTPEFKKAVQMYVKLMKDAGPSGILNYTYVEEQSAFLAGQVAQCIDTSNWVTNFEDPAQSKVVGKVGYAVLPAGISGKPSVGNGGFTWAQGIAKDSKKKGAAWYWTQFTTGPAASANYMFKRGMAGRTSALLNPDVQYKYPKDWLNAINTSIFDKYCTPADINSTSMFEAVMTMLQNVYSDPAGIDKYLADCQKAVEAAQTK